MQLSPSEIKLNLCEYISYLILILKIDRREFDHFLKGLRNMVLKGVLIEVADSLFWLIIIHNWGYDSIQGNKDEFGKQMMC